MTKKGFTLVEMMIAIAIFSLIAIFLYRSYDSFQRTNTTYTHITSNLRDELLIKQTLYIDFSLAMGVKIKNQDKNYDVVFFQTPNSLHNRINPYVAYIPKDGHLYRLESLHKFSTYPLEADRVADVDDLGKITRFRL